MSRNSKIEWTDHTFNPWIGCQKVSPGCDHCYAEEMMDRRYGRVQWGPHGERARTSDANWRQPLRWAKAARETGTRPRVFCASLADVFDNHVPLEWRSDLWGLIYATPELDWLLLTKRPENIRGMLPPEWGAGWPNVSLGTSVESQDQDRRLIHLVNVPCGLRFLSVEPLLGPLLLQHDDMRDGTVRNWLGKGGVGWVIVGGESGRNARPMHPDWARSLRDQCAAAGVAFFFKQWGEHVSGYLDGDDFVVDEDTYGPHVHWRGTAQCIRGRSGGPLDLGEGCWGKVGKKAAGRLLDGREWNDTPGKRMKEAA